MKRVWLALKIAWVAAMVAALVWYVNANWDDFAAYSASIGLTSILVSGFLLLLGKLALAQIAIEALKVFGLRLSFAKSFAIYSMAQLGKYLPGSIWHLVGRVLLYKGEGLPAREGGKLLIIENYWLLGSAVAVGIAGCGDEILRLLGLPPVARLVHPLALPLFVLVGWLIALTIGSRLFAARFARSTPATTTVYVLELLAWTVMGLAFWVLLPPDAKVMSTMPVAIGAFALGWVAGYLAPFAPAGVGVREAVIVALLGSWLAIPVAIAAVAFSRLVWTVLELALGAIAAGAYGRPRVATLENPPAA